MFFFSFAYILLTDPGQYCQEWKPGNCVRHTTRYSGFLFALSFNVATMEARTTRKLASSLSAPSPTTPISCRPIQVTPQLPEHPVSKQQSCAQWMPCILASLGSRWTGQRKCKTSQFYTSPSCRVAAWRHFWSRSRKLSGRQEKMASFHKTRSTCQIGSRVSAFVGSSLLADWHRFWLETLGAHNGLTLMQPSLKIQLDLHQMQKEKNVATSTIIVTGVIVTVEEFMSNIRRIFFLVEDGCVV